MEGRQWTRQKLKLECDSRRETSSPTRSSPKRQSAGTTQASRSTCFTALCWQPITYLDNQFLPKSAQTLRRNTLPTPCWTPRLSLEIKHGMISWPSLNCSFYLSPAPSSTSSFLLPFTSLPQFQSSTWLLPPPSTLSRPPEPLLASSWGE